MADPIATPTDPRWEDLTGRRFGLYLVMGYAGKCDAWRNSFEAFLADMGERPEGTSIERIRSDRNYEPGNCRWATAQEQARNQKSNRFVVVGGVEMHITDALAATGVNKSTFYRRLKRGLSDQEALAN